MSMKYMSQAEFYQNRDQLTDSMFIHDAMGVRELYPDRQSHGTNDSSEIQKRFDLKVYHFLKDTFLFKRLASYRVSERYPFTEATNDIHHRLNNAGLINKWDKNDTEGGIAYIWEVSSSLNLKTNDPNIEQFSIPTLVWYGWTAAVIVFLCEISWNKVKRVFGRCYRCKW